MGMYVSLHRLAPEPFQRIFQNPELCMEALAPAELDTFELGLPDRPEDWVSLDKAWHGLHFLLTGTSWEGEEPLCYIVWGGTELEWDTCFFEVLPRALTPEQVRAWHIALQEIDEATLRSRFDGPRMDKLSIYPTIWSRDPAQDDTLGYLLTNYRGLRDFLRDAAAGGYGVLVTMS